MNLSEREKEYLNDSIAMYQRWLLESVESAKSKCQPNDFATGFAKGVEICTLVLLTRAFNTVIEKNPNAALAEVFLECKFAHLASHVMTGEGPHCSAIDHIDHELDFLTIEMIIEFIMKGVR